ncbi:HNH endonuclease family protein [Rhizobium sp. NXC14]|uniref:HNH endonuclease n=1 Tax=Rhizobium sp. NXC14 TaxID=1981173 RepID=UPI000A205499|nr:HNH endonuclease signature motif containing protein [Rhizobium sp. NXC14]ARO31295.1 HNH endonuclease family protein [Rhizobium sp. NXC14]
MFAIAPTDLDWFDRLKTGPVPRLVNFWTPTPWNVRRLTVNDRFYFLLKHPIRKVGGYGNFDSYVEMPAEDAWEKFGIGNGLDSKEDLIAKVRNFTARRSLATLSGNPRIGCILLREAVFLNDDEFVAPDNVGHLFPRQVVKLKYFNDVDLLAPALGASILAKTPFTLIAGTGTKKQVSRKDRKGQAVFRQVILRNYGHRCCITGSTQEELLEAAHIQPYVDSRSDHPQNGLCMRADIHRLFDSGLITIDSSLQLQVSPKLKDVEYVKMKGQPVTVPALIEVRPSAKALEYHHDQVFRPKVNA